MRKPIRPYDQELPADADYKMEWLHDRDKENFESADKWVYLGADIKILTFAKVGITMGDLVSRSYSSARPNFYLFCAFQCKQSTTKSQLEQIERSAHRYLDRVFTNPDGTTKRVCHYESGRMSECYDDIDFFNLFQSLHDFLFEKHSRHFTICSFEGEYEIYEGDFLNCEFNPRIPLELQKSYLRMLLR